ncbi:hypothetical protein ACLMJK_004797 [Lecanora helva]
MESYDDELLLINCLKAFQEPVLLVRNNSVFIMSKITIPERSSSKTALLGSISQKKRQLEEESVEIVKKIKLEKSYDLDYWRKLRESERINLQAQRLERKISMIGMNLDDENEADIKQWESESKDADGIIVKEQALKAKVQQLEKQAKRIQAGSEDKKSAKVWMEFFMSSKLGMNIDIGVGRSDTLQKQFKEELKTKMGTRHESNPNYWWCPVVSDWFPQAAMKAGHLFPARSGDDGMTAIFGPSELDRLIDQPEKGKSELFRAVNGIWWSAEAEDRFERGEMCLVPDLQDNATPAEVQAWQNAATKDYKIRVVRPQAKKMLLAISPNDLKLWTSLDNKNLDFKGKDFRPRARYVYWAYLTTMLSLAYSEKGKDGGLHRQVAQAEVGKLYWGSAGSYMRKNMLPAFVENMGHEFGQIVRPHTNVEESEDAEASDTGFTHMNEAIIHRERKAKAQDLGEEEDDEDSDHDDDEN